MKSNILFTIFFLLFLISCGNYEKSLKIREQAIDFSTVGVDFQTIKTAIFIPYCISCHKQYENWNSVKGDLDKIMVAINSDRMPKNAPAISNNLKFLLRDWEAQGAPQTPEQEAPEPLPVGLQPLWNSVSENILIPKCIVCHNSQGEAKFLDLSSRQSIFAARNKSFGDDKKLINFDVPEESYLIDIITDEFEPMPPLPPFSNLGRLNQEEVDVLIEWIKRGIP